jgi:hypothetical protein
MNMTQMLETTTSLKVRIHDNLIPVLDALESRCLAFSLSLIWKLIDKELFQIIIKKCEITFLRNQINIHSHQRIVSSVWFDVPSILSHVPSLSDVVCMLFIFAVYAMEGESDRLIKICMTVDNKS